MQVRFLKEVGLQPLGRRQKEISKWWSTEAWKRRHVSDSFHRRDFLTDLGVLASIRLIWFWRTGYFLHLNFSVWVQMVYDPQLLETGKCDVLPVRVIWWFLSIGGMYFVLTIIFSLQGVILSLLLGHMTQQDLWLCFDFLFILSCFQYYFSIQFSVLTRVAMLQIYRVH